MDKELDNSRLVRIETRLARLQENMGMPTRLTSEEITNSSFNDDDSLGSRLARIETRIFRLLEAMNLNPRTGRPK